MATTKVTTGLLALTGDVTSSGNNTTVTKINGTSLAGLATGILKNTTSTGVPSIAVAGDFPTLNQNTTGNAATATSVADTGVTFTDNTTGNASISAHGFLPKLSNISTQFLNGQGNFATPSGTANSYLSQSFTAQTSVLVTHNFGAYPTVQVVDNAGLIFDPVSITHNSSNAFTVAFDPAKTGNIIASVGSPQPNTLVVATGNYTTLATDYFVKCTGAGSTITLVTASGNTGRVQHIINTATADITVDGNSSETINGSLTQVLPPNSTMSIVSDGTNWSIF